MPRNTDISTILFPVELRPVNYTANPATALSDESELPFAKGEDVKPIDQYQAVVRGDTGRVFAVVSKRYELLHNSRALDLGKKAFEHIFPEASASDFVVFDIQSTKTGSACHIDLIHKSYSTEVWQQETWLPFLRVSNSYNRYRALSFDFGFVRKLCSNGVIFRKETIRARFYHTKGRLEVDLKQDKTFKTLKGLEAEFAKHIKDLRNAKIARKHLVALALHLLQQKFDLNAQTTKRRDQEQRRLTDVVTSLGELVTHYVKDLGDNAYTALNAATDLATHSPMTAGPFATSAALQESIGERARIFLDQLSSGERVSIESLLKNELVLVG